MTTVLYIDTAAMKCHRCFRGICMNGTPYTNIVHWWLRGKAGAGRRELHVRIANTGPPEGQDPRLSVQEENINREVFLATPSPISSTCASSSPPWGQGSRGISESWITAPALYPPVGQLHQVSWSISVGSCLH